MKSVLKSLVVLVLFALVMYAGVWRWMFCRFYVGPDEMAILTAKLGDELPAGQYLAEPGQKGVLRDVLGEGRHFRNPVLFDHKIVSCVSIPPGKVGVVTSKVGTPLAQGEFLADKGQKGVWRSVLGPGRYRLNPNGYEIEVVDALSVPIGYAGVVTSLSGERALEGAFAEGNQKGVRRDILQPGLYYVNPKEYRVDVLEIGLNQVSLLGREGGRVFTKNVQVGQSEAVGELQRSVFEEQRKKRSDYASQSQSLSLLNNAPSKPSRQGWDEQQGQQGAQQRGQQPAANPLSGMLGLSEFVEFPSRDGFQIRLDMTVEVELLPSDIAGIFRAYGDLPALVDKILLPQIMSVSRNKGSEYRARDFIVGEGREKFQNDLKETLAAALAEKRVVVHNALVRHVEVPSQILEPIQLASVAREQDLTNKTRQETAKKQAELNTELALIEQRRQQVDQETSKLQGEIRADLERQVAELQAEATRAVAEIAKETAAIKADTVKRLAQADAAARQMVEGERAKGLQLQASAFGAPEHFTLWAFARELNPDVKIRILHAGEGTLWTDLERATLGDLGGTRLLRPAAK